MLIGNLVGGLGNQMFQYANALSLSLEFGLQLKFRTDAIEVLNSHNGFELEKVFGLKLEIASDDDLVKLIGRWRSLLLARQILGEPAFTRLAGRHFLSEPYFKYWPALHQLAKDGGYMQGYWQSERYFTRHSSQIRTAFTFRDELDGTNLRISQAISKRPAISVHVRRGDYLTNTKTLSVHGVCSLEYYHAAIDRLMQRLPRAQLFAFSDDPEWVTQVLRPRYPSMVVVGHNKGQESYNDMRLMSMCQHHVIANSTFSWWGAWLNPLPDKIVIAPARWFANGNDSGDIIPASWLQM